MVDAPTLMPTPKRRKNKKGQDQHSRNNYHTNFSASGTCLSLTGLPNDALLEIMKRLGKTSYESFVNAKATCKTLKKVGEHPYVVKRISINQIPLFKEDDVPVIQSVIDASLVAGNLSALFRHAMLHSFCAGGNYRYGYDILKNTAERGLHSAVYVWSLVLTAHSVCAHHNYEPHAIKLWSSIYSEDKINEIRSKLQPWFPVLAPRLVCGGILRVRIYSQCAAHFGMKKDSQSCMRCRLDEEVKWFVEAMGREYAVEQ